MWRGSGEASASASSKDREGGSVFMWRRRQGHFESVARRGPGNTRRTWEEGDVEETGWRLTPICPAEQIILYSQNNSVGFVHYVRGIFCCEYRLDLRWAHIVAGGDVNAVHRWHREREVSYSFMCRWTSCNFEQVTWMIALPYPWVQAKTQFPTLIQEMALFFLFFFLSPSFLYFLPFARNESKADQRYSELKHSIENVISLCM